MKQIPTLKERVSQISIGTFIISIAIILTSFILYSMKKSEIAEEHIIRELTANAQAQVNQFIPSFLLPEQRQGIELLLERLKKTEHLEAARIIRNKKELSPGFENCQLDPALMTTCATQDHHLTAVIVPLVEAGNHYGHLLKVKRNISPTSFEDTLQVAGIIFFILCVTFTVIYLFITRLLSRTLPTALDDLVKWIETDLTGKKRDDVRLPYKELEELKIKISEVLEKYNSSRDQAIIGQLTSGIMHDIKTPLQSIVAAMHLVEEQEPGTSKRLSRLENAHLMSTKNLPLICDIIETTLDGSRTINIEKKNSDIVNTIQQSLALNTDMARRRQVSVEQNFSAGNAFIPHDSVQFTRVVQNLVKNAIEAASDNNEKKIIKVSTVDTKEGFLFTIEDSGKGFDFPQDKIFKAFRTTKLRGTGLGLVITKKIIEAHGGSISALNSSDLGGAKLEVLLPKINEVQI